MDSCDWYEASRWGFGVGLYWQDVNAVMLLTAARLWFASGAVLYVAAGVWCVCVARERRRWWTR